MTAIPMPLTVDEISSALAIAKALVIAGVPMFIAPPDPAHPAGFALPMRWQETTCDPSVIDRWQPGWALCAVGGYACDFADIDPRNGGDASREQAADIWPTVYGRAATPSGGIHELIAPLNIGTYHGKPGSPLVGIDIQGGRSNHQRSSRGFVFLAPTERRSKVDGVRRAYRWLVTPDVARLRAATDVSGRKLAALLDKPVVRFRAPDHRPPEFFCDFTPSEAQQAIRTVLTQIRSCIDGGWAGFRNVLNKAGYTLGGLVATEYISAEQAQKLIADEIKKAGYTITEENAYTVEVGIDEGQQEPMWVRLTEPKPPPPSFLECKGGSANLPDEFWASRKVLSQIRDSAHSRTRSADAVLGVILARISSMLPGDLRVDTGVASPASLNYFSILMGTSAAGKSSASDIASELLPMMHNADSEEHVLGSGQGIASAYGMVVDGEFKQCYSKAFFSADEGAGILALARNKENTTMATLRQAWSGRVFGQRNATGALNRKVEKYSMGIWLGLQPMHAAQLFADLAVDDGTLQRFVWFNATDPTIPRRRGKIKPLQRLDWDLGSAWNAHHIEVPEWLCEQIWDHAWQIQCGLIVPPPGQEHNQLLQVKTSSLLCILDDRHSINEEDWELAGIILDTSAAVTQLVKDDIARRLADKERREVARKLRLITAEAKHLDKLDEEKLYKMSARAVELVGNHPDGIPSSQLWKLISTRDSALARAAVQLAITEQKLKEERSPNGQGRIIFPVEVVS